MTEEAANTMFALAFVFIGILASGLAVTMFRVAHLEERLDGLTTKSRDK